MEYTTTPRTEAKPRPVMIDIPLDTFMTLNQEYGAMKSAIKEAEEQLADLHACYGTAMDELQLLRDFIKSSTFYRDEFAVFQKEQANEETS